MSKLIFTSSIRPFVLNNTEEKKIDGISKVLTVGAEVNIFWGRSRQ